MKPSCGVKVFLLTILFLVVAAGWAWAADVTIIGEVNDNYQIVSDNQIYEVADTAKGHDLVDNYISARVEVTGVVEEVDDMKIITVVSFNVLTD